jgi:hypothetical protein
LRQEELKDEREPDHEGRTREEARGYGRGAIAHLDHFRRVAVFSQHGREVSHAQVALVLESDERYFRPASRGRRRLVGGGEVRARA